MSKPVILVDPEDKWLLERWSWQINRYVVRSKWVKNSDGMWKHKSEYLHKVICPSPEGFITDHINGNRLDNRRSNLRVCTQKNNTWNAKPRKDNRLGTKGVVWREKSRDYVAYINVNKKRICLKTHKTLESAIRARKAAEAKYHGIYAYQEGGY